MAILLIKMEWLKEDRTLNGAILRQKYYKPIRIEDGINLCGNGIFFTKCHYYQQGDSVLSAWEISDGLDKKLYEEGLGKGFSGSDERKQKSARRRQEAIQKSKGAFYRVEKLDVSGKPCVPCQKRIFMR